jgi:hypothetical protein
MKLKYLKLVASLTKKGVPCKVSLKTGVTHDKIVIECGCNFPDKIFNRIYDVAEGLGMNQNEYDVCAEEHGGTTLESTRIAGGPRRY